MTLENIIWVLFTASLAAPSTYVVQQEAKQRPGTLKETRRPSTTIDDNGCVITRGFTIPSRSSSFDSIATQSSSSYGTPGTPLSTIEEPAPGYSRPSGSLYEAPELQCLKDHSTRSLHRPARSAGSIEFGARPIRPSVGIRRSTWQQQQQPNSRLSNEDLTSARCRASSRLTQELEKRRAQTMFEQVTTQFHASKKPLRRSRTESQAPANLESESRKETARGQSRLNKSKDAKVQSKMGDNSAIASDSESDDEFVPATAGCIVGGITAQRSRPAYALRRALSDQRAAQAQEQQQTTADSERDHQAVKVDFALMYQAGSAIESEDEEADISIDDPVAAALDLARIHRSRNSITARMVTEQSSGGAPTQDTAILLERPPSAPRATFVPIITQQDDPERPEEICAFKPESPTTQKPLRPSRSQPRPIKGVLKNSCSRASSPTSGDLCAADSTARRGSAPVVITSGPTEARTLLSQKSKSTLALSNPSVHFTPIARSGPNLNDDATT